MVAMECCNNSFRKRTADITDALESFGHIMSAFSNTFITLMTSMTSESTVPKELVCSKNISTK